MSYKSVLGFWVAVVISVLFASACVEGKVLPEIAKIVPPETVLLVEVGDFSQLKAQFEKTNIYKLYKDPAMAPFIDDAKTKWQERTRQRDNEISKAIVDADILPQGRLAFALVSGGQTKDADVPPFLFISQWGENLDKIKEAVDKQVKKAVEDGAHRKTESYRGITIVTIIKQRPPKQVPDWSSYKPEHNDVPTKTVQPPPAEIHYCFIDDCLIGSVNLDALKFVIAHIQGATSPTLTSEVNYTPTIKAVGPYHDINLYVNIKQLIKAAVTGDASGQAQTMVTNLGLDNVTAFGFSIGLARRPDSSCCGRAFLKINGAKKGICKMLDIESDILRVPRFIPESAYSTTFINLNIKRAYDELYNILYKFDPAGAAKMQAPLLPSSPDGQAGVQLKTDIIDHLGSNTVIAQSINKPLLDSSAPAESIVALAINNRNALEKSLSLLHSKMIAPDNPDARRELLGHTIYVVDISAMLPFLVGGMTPMQYPAGAAVPQMPKLAFTVTDTHLIFGTESSVEQAIRMLNSTETVSVASAEWFSSAKLAIPSVVGLACFQDNAASAEFFWKTLKEGAKSKTESANPNVSMGVSMCPDPGLIFSQMGLFDPGLLPEFDAVRKYFGQFTFYGISRPDGFFFEFNNLNPTEGD